MKHKNSPSEVISFRATNDLLRLIDQARKPFKASRSAWVRGTITSYFYEADGEEPVSRLIEEMTDELGNVQKNMAQICYLVLTIVGKMPKDQAKAMIQDHLLQ